MGNTVEKRIITNEYLALPIDINLNLNEIYRDGLLLNEAELEALLRSKMEFDYTIDQNAHPKSILGAGKC